MLEQNDSHRDGLAPPPETAHVSFINAFTSEGKFVWNSLRRLGVRRMDLEDLTHEVFLAVHRHWHEYDPTRPLRPWLFGFTYHTATRYLDLARHSREVLGEQPNAIDPTSSVEERLGKARLQARLQEALAGLPLEQKAVFIMHDVDETAMPDVAEALGIPLNTAYSRLRLARAALKKTVGGEP